MSGVKGTAPLSRFEPHETISYIDFLDKIPRLRKMWVEKRNPPKIGAMLTMTTQPRATAHLC